MSFKIHRKVSKLFQPISILPKNAIVKHQEVTSKSQRLMLELGIIRQAYPGVFHYLPLGVRVLEKLVKIIDNAMLDINAQKVIFPTLISGKLWERSGRLHDVSAELFKVEDRHKNIYLLSPTHEEAASDLLSSISPISYKNFPIRLYQITSKFRDEMKPRFGLMRSRQFIMKDLYTFDVDDQSAMDTYEVVCEAYDNFFKTIGIDTKKVLGLTGFIGGSLSHEYHFLAEVGEDTIKTCTKCNLSYNAEVYKEEICKNCGGGDIRSNTGIEVGHTFLLGEKYSKPLNAQYISKDKKSVNLKMGCYGLGVSRIISAVAEVLSTEQEIRWPTILAPFKAIIIPPKEGSKEESSIGDQGEKLYNSLNSKNQLRDDVIYDDRTHMTIGRRFLEAKRMGYPYVIVLGKRIMENPSLYEVFIAKTNSITYVTENDLAKLILDEFN